jgi:hypothetical protein
LYFHLIAIQKGWIKLQYNYENTNIINKIYNDIISLNFEENEIEDIVSDFFYKKLTWDQFKKFRDLILLGSDRHLEKIYFVTSKFDRNNYLCAP